MVKVLEEFRETGRTEANGNEDSRNSGEENNSHFKNVPFVLEGGRKVRRQEDGDTARSKKGHKTREERGDN